MNMLSRSEGYNALIIDRSTGAFFTHRLNSEDHALAVEWARCLAQSCRVELWHNAELVGSFPPLQTGRHAIFAEAPMRSYK
ncbi:hypothetical protein [Microvirga zambiensis]|jgi:hypothetical protein|uniref:hypothetical protein n=1 Tax=Microvirga zambiensis TaxID=1402137 RepID=UPI00191EB7BA|nr:hypothetical protein [Microvirga zambiensis]